MTYNGWYDKPGKEDARRILGLLGMQVSRDFTAGAMLARGHSVKSVKDLRALRKCWPRRRPAAT